MLIDWFTVGAQILNFVVLVWVLKRFLYQPILTAIDTRASKVAAERAKAGADTAAAARTSAELAEKQRLFDAERAALLAKAGADAILDRTRLFEAAQKEMGDLRAKHDALLRAAMVNTQTDIKRLAVTEVYEIARKILGDLASVSLEACMVGTLIGHLKAMTADVKKSILAATPHASPSGIIRSRFALQTKEQTSLRKALVETLAVPLTLTFITEPTLVCGVEAELGGQRWSWSLTDSLTRLQQQTESLLDAESPATPAAAI